MATKLFPEEKNFFPKIYAYSDSHPEFKGLLKIGYTIRDVKERVKEQYPSFVSEKEIYKIELIESAVRPDGTTFTDVDVHKILEDAGFIREHREWFRCSVKDVTNAIKSILTRTKLNRVRNRNFEMRREQIEAVDKAAYYFNNYFEKETGKTPHFLWNAKMRFGKTFAAYQLMKKMNWKRVLVLTFKPAVESAWEEDLYTHSDFEEWQLVSRNGLKYEDVNKSDPFVCFGSFQDFLGRNEAGGIKPKNEWVHNITWDCVIIDEYHFGAWREAAKELFEEETESESKKQLGEGIEIFSEELMPIRTNAYLYLSGTPFRAIASGEFIEEQIFNWTYTDEQQAKIDYEGDDNPYLALPKMILLTYQLPESIKKVAEKGEFNEFDLNTFFQAEGDGDEAKFKFVNEVQKWLDFIRGANLKTIIDNLGHGTDKLTLPFSDVSLLSFLNHTFWFLPSVAACFAMRNLLRERQNTFYHDYNIITASGIKAGLGVNALNPVMKAMNNPNPIESKSITLSCGKLTTGVTVRPWTGIFMLRNLTSPETYFQAAFRVQSPWEINNPDGMSPNQKEILKENCYVFDFAPNRALKQIADYSCRLNVTDSNVEKKVGEFIKFLPVLAYDGSAMKKINASEILDIAQSGTSATLLARRWESHLLVNVDNETLARLMESEEAMAALMSIEGFRRLNKEIETIINNSKIIKDTKRKANDIELTPSEKKQLSKSEKEYRNTRKQIQERLIKFITRIPIFMYLTDFREKSLKDVITKLEPGLFKKVTGLTLEDFELLVSLGVFNGELMNDAIYKFKRYEDESLSYTGINKHEGEEIGLFDTVVSK